MASSARCRCCGGTRGYALAITVWIELVGAVATAQPWVPTLAKLVAVAFLVWSAFKLWRGAGRAGLGERGITLSRVFLTTLLNPKALVFAFAIFPPIGFVARLPYGGVFAMLVVATAMGWMLLGVVAQKSSAGLLTSARVDRITAVALAVFAAVLLVQTLA